jgi:hypothetical protein
MITSCHIYFSSAEDWEVSRSVLPKKKGGGIYCCYEYGFNIGRRRYDIENGRGLDRFVVTLWPEGWLNCKVRRPCFIVPVSTNLLQIYALGSSVSLIPSIVWMNRQCTLVKA